MKTRSFRKFLLVSGLVSMVLLSSLSIAVGPAQAYTPNPTVYWYKQNADYCTSIAQYDPNDRLYGGIESLDCYINHTLGRKLFDYDDGGTNVAVELWHYGSMVGQVFLEGRDEILTVADTANDDDALYVWIGSAGPYHAVGSSDPVDIDDFDLNLKDGSTFLIRITDDKAGNDLIASTGNGLPSFVA